MVDVTVVGPEALDFRAFVALQRESFAEIIAKTGTAYLFDEANYRWKYRPPAGEARIALVVDAGELVAANAMFPVTVRSRGETVAAWQSCDTATHPKARGKGHFLRCLTALRETLPGNSIFFGFPNANSMPGFVKFGWRHHSDLRARVRILPGRSPERFRQVQPILDYGAAHDEFAGAVSGRMGAHVDRSAAYMRWRYLRHPLHRYESFSWIEDGRPAGLLVLRDVHVLARRHAVALELWALEPKVERGLLRFAAAWAGSRGITLSLAINNTLGASSLLAGYLPVPRWAMPKRQVLMGSASGGDAARLWDGPWSVQIGDWDGF